MLPRLVIFDMDGTVVQYPEGSFQSSWDAVGFAAGKKEEWERRLRDYIKKSEQNSELYLEWVEKDCASLKGMPVNPVLEKIFPPPYIPGFPEFCTYLGEEEVKKVIVSSGVDLVAKRIQEENNLDDIVANEVHVKDGRFTGTGKVNIDLKSKGLMVRKVMEQYETSKEEAAFFGDHINDIPAWKEVGMPLGINIKDESCYPYIHRNFADFHEALNYFKLGKEFKFIQ